MSSIIHFTNTFKKFRNILLESSFRLHYCRESFYLGESLSSAAVHPMVSFSEHIVKNIDQKTITYGRYGLGLKKEWVTKKKLHPVLYIDSHSHIAQALSVLLKARRKRVTIELAPNVKMAIMTIKCFTKNARGYNSYYNRPNFNFRLEREWRYVPTKSEINNNLISRTRRIYNKDPDYYNQKLFDFPLKFQIADIEYLFVKTEKQRSDLIKEFGFNKNVIKISGWRTELII